MHFAPSLRLLSGEQAKQEERSIPDSNRKASDFCEVKYCVKSIHIFWIRGNKQLTHVYKENLGYIGENVSEL